MSSISLLTAALAIGLATCGTALAALPGGIGQSGEAVRIVQSGNGVEQIHLRRFHHHHQHRFLFNQRRTCGNDRRMHDSDWCRNQFRRHNHPGIYFRMNNLHRNERSDPNFGFSINF